jgi:hypothetical protein
VLTLWACLTQVASPDVSCRAAEARVLAWLGGQGRQPCTPQADPSWKARQRLPEAVLRPLRARSHCSSGDPSWGRAYGLVRVGHTLTIVHARVMGCQRFCAGGNPASDCYLTTWEPTKKNISGMLSSFGVNWAVTCQGTRKADREGDC